MGDISRMSVDAAPMSSNLAPAARIAAAVLTLCFALVLDRAAWGFGPLSHLAASSVADTSDSARREALRSIPLEKLASGDRAKVESVLSNVSVFRRMPLKVIDCDPDMYLFLVRHPDIIVNIWEVMRVSKLQMRQVGEGKFTLAEPDGASVALEFVHQSHDTHVVYGEGTYRGPLLSRPVNGRGVLVLKTGYVCETNGRYYITNRLDCFLSVEQIGAELLTKTVSPLLGKTADNNFVLSAAFLGNLSRTAELNSRGVRTLAARLDRVPPEVRTRFADLAEEVKAKSAVAARAGGSIKR